ncbi:unnamed protein product [Effrenium voratum]|nr:unnamed protein product [Effrenium voratum]
MAALEKADDTGLRPAGGSEVCDEDVAAVRILQAAGFDCAQLLSLGHGAAALRRSGVAAAELRSCGVDLAGLYGVGYSAKELLQCGYTPLELKQVGVTGAELKEIGCSARLLRDLGFQARELRAFRGRELLEMGKDAGFPPQELQSLGPQQLGELFTLQELRDAGLGPKELKAAGFHLKDLMQHGFSFPEVLVEGGFPADQIHPTASYLFRPSGATANCHAAAYAKSEKSASSKRGNMSVLEEVAFFPGVSAAACTSSLRSSRSFVQDAGKELQYLITSLPSSGSLYETSQNYRTYGTDPKYAATSIKDYELPFKLTDALGPAAQQVRWKIRQAVVIDGNLNESVWEEVPFTDTAFQDIAQPLFPDYVLPKEFATRVKVRWDADFMYVGAFIGEPWVEQGFVRGSNPSLASTNPISNSNVPYYDNDFEVFIDVSGSNHWYKEFEMNFNNATYDVLWRVPDTGLGSTGVPCCAITSSSCERYCMNSSWPPFGGTWSMFPHMKTATARASGWAIPGWTVEIAFPLRPSQGVGGLLSAGHGTYIENADPNAGAKFWSVDFSRAEHPFFTSNSSLFGQLCPSIQKTQPTLLGDDQWSCYWEWVWQDLGGHRYMHNPDTFGFLQFAPFGGVELCGNVRWPARYILAQVYQAQVAYAQRFGNYSSRVWPLLGREFCRLDNGCHARTLLQVATKYREIYNLKILVDNEAATCVRYATNSIGSNYTGGPCFNASVDMRMPSWSGLHSRVHAQIREDRLLEVEVTGTHERVVYIPPSDVFPPEGRWAALTYEVQEPLAGNKSEQGQVSFSSPSQQVAASTFVGGTDAWTISGNSYSNVPTWQAFGWGILNRYIYGTDEVQYIDFDTSSDKSKWYFEPSPGKFYLPELATAYGGTLKFTIASTYGDFAHLNNPLDFITLECSSCNSGRGLRIVRFADNGLEWAGQEKIMQVILATGNHWWRDPMNAALPFTDATECEIAAVGAPVPGKSASASRIGSSDRVSHHLVHFQSMRMLHKPTAQVEATYKQDRYPAHHLGFSPELDPSTRSRWRKRLKNVPMPKPVRPGGLPSNALVGELRVLLEKQELLMQSLLSQQTAKLTEAVDRAISAQELLPVKVELPERVKVELAVAEVSQVELSPEMDLSVDLCDAKKPKSKKNMVLSEPLEEEPKSVSQQLQHLLHMCCGSVMEALAAVLILTNAVLFGIQADHVVKNPGSEPTFFATANFVFTVLFTLELSVRVFREGKFLFSCYNPDIKWNIMDAILVAFGLFEEILTRSFSVTSAPNMSSARILRLLRLVRVARVLRVLRFFSDLRVMILGVLSSLKALMWALILLFFIIYIASVCILQFVGEHLKENPQDLPSGPLEFAGLSPFSSLATSCFTLFLTISGGISWGELAPPLMAVNPLLTPVLTLYVALAMSLGARPEVPESPHAFSPMEADGFERGGFVGPLQGGLRENRLDREPGAFFGQPAHLETPQPGASRLALPSPGAILEEKLSRPTSLDVTEATETWPPTPSSPKTKATSPGKEPAGSRRSLTAFSRRLALATASAPERLAEKLIEQLRQSCLDEANLGKNMCTWDGTLPGSRRFSSQVAQALAGQLQEVGFASVEWWAGKDFKDTGGKYLVIHNAMYDKYTVRLRVKWSHEVQLQQQRAIPRPRLEGPVLSILRTSCGRSWSCSSGCCSSRGRRKRRRWCGRSRRRPGPRRRSCRRKRPRPRWRSCCTRPPPTPRSRR